MAATTPELKAQLDRLLQTPTPLEPSVAKQ